MAKDKRHPEGKQIGGIYNRNGHWYAKVKVRGVQKWVSAPTLEDAQLALGRLREDAARERMGLPKVQRETLKTFAPRFLAWAKASKRSWDRYELSLKPLVAALGHLKLREITKARADTYRRERLATESLPSIRVRKGFDRRRKDGEVARDETPPAPRMLSVATVNRDLACLKKLLSYAVEIGELEANPLQGLKLEKEGPGRIPKLEPDEEAALMAALAEWMRPIARLALLTGCRESEILALRWRHVDFNASTLTIENSKSGESRRIPMHPALAEELRERRGLPDGWVVTMPCKARRDRETGKWLDPIRDPHSVSQAFRRAVRAIGRPDLRFHDCRHVALSRLSDAGANAIELKTVAGHKTLAMVARYAHTSPARMAGLMAALPAPVAPAHTPAEVKA